MLAYIYNKPHINRGNTYFSMEMIMKKQTLLVSAIGLLTLGEQTICMEKKVRALARPDAAALARKPYQHRDAHHVDPHMLRPFALLEKAGSLQEEAYILCTQQYRQAQQEGKPLPGFFFTELAKYYAQVNPNDLELKGKFGNLLQVTKPLKEPELAPIPPLDDDEDFAEESLTSDCSSTQ